MWDVIRLLIDETKEINNEGKSFDIPSSISQQLPHFCCINIMINKAHQKDISRYLYCQKFHIPPYPGSYEEQPYKWIIKSNIIQNALYKKQERAQKKAYDKINKGKANVK